MQGTAATVLAGLYGAMKVQGLGPEALKDQVNKSTITKSIIIAVVSTCSVWNRVKV